MNKPTYNELSDAELIQTYWTAAGADGTPRFRFNQVDYDCLRAIIAADRAIQLKPRTVKCRLFQDAFTGAVHCATENSTKEDWQSLSLRWIGPIFERDL